MLDRIRQVEEKVENGVTVTVAQSGAASQGMAEVQPKQKPQLPKAVPEEVQQIVTRWPAIVGSAENPMRIYLKNAKLSLGGDNKLMVVLEDGMASDYFLLHAENKAQLEALLSDFSGREIEVNLQTVKSRQEFEDNYIDLSQVVRMDIEIEEE